MATKLNLPRVAAERLGLTNANTLAVWRCTKRYPLPYVRVGARIFYTDEAIENFIKSRTVTPGGGSKAKRVTRRAKKRS